MGMGVRVFVVGTGGELQKWSYKRFERVFDGQESVPEFAGRRLQYAMLFVDLEEGRSVRVKHVEWRVLRIDHDGKHNPTAAMRAAMDAFSPPPLPETIVDARARFNQRASSWTPTPKLKSAILEAALR